MNEREIKLHRETLSLLRLILQSKTKSAFDFSDWKDADDWLFAQLDFTKEELKEIFVKGDMAYIESAK